MPDYPKRQGYRLTEEGENLYGNWLDIRSCSCHTGCAPCSTCTHEGHPISLEETDEVWEIDEEKWEIIPMYNNFQIKDFIYRGWTVEQMIQQSILKLKQEETMSRTEIKDKGSGSKKSEWFGYKYRVTPETSKLLQEAVFKDGGGWSGKQDFKSRCTHIFITEDGYMTYLNDGDDEYFEEESDLPEKDPPQVKTKKEFKYGYWYKLKDRTYGLDVGKYYRIKEVDSRCSCVKVYIGDSYSNHIHETRFDVNSESTFNPTVSVDLQNENTTSVTVVKARPVKDNPQFYLGEFNAEINNFINKQEESNMSNANRRVVNVKLLDNDSGLPVENSLVAQFDNIVTEDSNDVVVQEILLNKNIADSIAKHNQKRVEQTDLEILKRTGNDVKLRQVKLKDLTWIVTTA